MKNILKQITVSTPLCLLLNADCITDYNQMEAKCLSDYDSKSQELKKDRDLKIKSSYTTLYEYELPLIQVTYVNETKKCQRELETRLSKIALEATTEVAIASAVYYTAVVGCPFLSGPAVAQCEAVALKPYSGARFAIAARATQQTAAAYIDDSNCRTSASDTANISNVSAEGKYNLSVKLATNEFKISDDLAYSQKIACIADAEKNKADCLRRIQTVNRYP